MTDLARRNFDHLEPYVDRAMLPSVERMERAAGLARVGVSEIGALHREAAFEVFSTLALYERMYRRDCAAGAGNRATKLAYQHFSEQLIADISKLLGISSARIQHVIATASLDEDDRSWFAKLFG